MKTLKKEIDYLIMNKTEGSYLPAQGSDWFQSSHFNSTYYNEQFIDLKGLAIDYKTVVVEAASVQRGTYNYIFPATAGDRIYIYDIMTTIPIDITLQETQEDILFRGLGMLGTALNYEHVLYNRMQVFSYDVDFANGTAIKVDEAQCGSLQPTASDRIYCYRLVSFTTTGEVSGGVVAPVRFLLNVNVQEEPEYEYLMRLKRSYDLQQSHDED